jgi:hypothetical protein
MQVRVRRDCTRQSIVHSTGLGPSGHLYVCKECQARTYRKDGLMEHNPVEEWISLEDLREALGIDSLANAWKD